ncbi:MAG: DEAD/DEAH box helicase [Chloroflexi bacterium]|nr:MAG: DEAD/DEAH box helicase [Chloroflexota bacterium]
MGQKLADGLCTQICVRTKVRRRPVRPPNNYNNNNTDALASVMPVPSKFAALSLINWDYGDVVEFTARARGVLAESYNILDMRARDWQAAAINSIVNGFDLFVRAGTGCGKSLIYLAMIAAKIDGIVLVIAPLKSLINDQVFPK